MIVDVKKQTLTPPRSLMGTPRYDAQTFPDEYPVAKLLGHRRSGLKFEFLVRWKKSGQTVWNDSWEHESGVSDDLISPRAVHSAHHPSALGRGASDVDASAVSRLRHPRLRRFFEYPPALFPPSPLPPLGGLPPPILPPHPASLALIVRAFAAVVVTDRLRSGATLVLLEAGKGRRRGRSGSAKSAERGVCATARAET